MPDGDNRLVKFSKQPPKSKSTTNYQKSANAVHQRQRRHTTKDDTSITERKNTAGTTNRHAQDDPVMEHKLNGNDLELKRRFSAPLTRLNLQSQTIEHEKRRGGSKKGC